MKKKAEILTKHGTYAKLSIQKTSGLVRKVEATFRCLSSFGKKTDDSVEEFDMKLCFLTDTFPKSMCPNPVFYGELNIDQASRRSITMFNKKTRPERVFVEVAIIIKKETVGAHRLQWSFGLR